MFEKIISAKPKRNAIMLRLWLTVSHDKLMIVFADVLVFDVVTTS
jgi:hypothetical protein